MLFFCDEIGIWKGYVYIHSGIHGIGDPDPAHFDWQNLVKTIMVQQVNWLEESVSILKKGANYAWYYLPNP